MILARFCSSDSLNVAIPQVLYPKYADLYILHSDCYKSSLFSLWSGPYLFMPMENIPPVTIQEESYLSFHTNVSFPCLLKLSH
jgi:hypothetical protein